MHLRHPTPPSTRAPGFALRQQRARPWFRGDKPTDPDRREHDRRNTHHLLGDLSGDNVALTNLVVESVVSVDGAPAPSIVSLTHLAAPDPFNEGMEIRFEVPSPETACVSMYELRGRLVRILCDLSATSGWRSVWWDGCDRAGLPVPSGTYVYRIRAGKQTAVGRVQLVR